LRDSEELGGEYEHEVSAVVWADHVRIVLTCVVVVVLQMLWWGMDETLAELFAHHPSAGDFEGNPREKFRAVVDGHAYGLNQTPRSIGLYGGRYTIEFCPGESTGRTCCDHFKLIMLTPCCV
jgi:hypothetical protein